MSAPNEIVFPFDCDNTRLDNDQAQKDLTLSKCTGHDLGRIAGRSRLDFYVHVPGHR
jgi:hypothetical protein